jgi:NADH:ubiquinone oxidoreductase subunit 6 (subunit J)
VFTLSFTPIPSAFIRYPLFQWYMQSKEIILNLSMTCWNSEFNAQSSGLIIVVVQVGAVKVYVAAVEALTKKERQDETQELVWVTVISFCKILIPSYVFDGLLCRNWPFLPPNRMTLWTNLLKTKYKNLANFTLFS